MPEYTRGRRLLPQCHARVNSGLIVPLSTDSWQQLLRPIRTGTLSSVSGSPKPSFLNWMTSILCACAVSHIGLAMVAMRGGSSRTRLFNTQEALELIFMPGSDDSESNESSADVPEVFSGPDSVSSSDEIDEAGDAVGKIKTNAELCMRSQQNEVVLSLIEVEGF